jgi:hypothetical protein
MRSKKHVMIGGLITAIGGLVTALTIYLLLDSFSSDYVYSVIPGWHTTILRGRALTTLLTISILICSIVTYLIFKGIMGLLKKLWPISDIEK